MRYYVITDFKQTYTEQWLNDEEVKHYKEYYPNLTLMFLSDYKENIRTCSHCKQPMKQGYVIDNGAEYYCSDECLHQHYTTKEFLDLYDDGDGDSYYTEWDSYINN